MVILDLLNKVDASFVSTTMLMILAIVVILCILAYFKSSNLLSHFSKLSKNKEKRRQVRMPCDYIMEVWHPEKLTPIAQARVLDLSGAGASIACMARLNPGEPIIGRLLQTEHGNISIAGRIMWKRMALTSPLYGIRFDSARHS